MEQKTCETCKWWRVNEEDWKGYIKHGVGRCGSPSLVYIDSKGIDAMPPDGFGIDTDNSLCDLVTGPKFGCLKWEQK